MSPQQPLEPQPFSLTLDEALGPVAADLEYLTSHVLDFLPMETAAARAVCADILGGRGKRIRPALYLLGAQLTGYRGPHFYQMAAVCEFVHAASLLHDDVVDNSPTRRNRPTAHTVWGSTTAVLVGDLIYARASELMAATGNCQVVEMFARAIRMMSDGELLQLESIYSADLTLDRYLVTIRHKTATLIAASVSAPAMLAGTSAEQIDGLKVYGDAIGMAFQIVDDVLDFVSTGSLLGKPTADLEAGRITMPLILLLQNGPKDVAAKVRSLLQNLTTQRMAPEDANYIRKQVVLNEAAHGALQRARAFSADAIAALQVFPNNPARQQLERIAETLALRNL